MRWNMVILTALIFGLFYGLFFGVSTAQSQNLEWVHSLEFAGPYSLEVGGPAKDVYLAGDFHGNTDFDPGPGSAILNAPGVTTDAFIAKYDHLGAYIWAKELNSSIYTWIQDIAVDSAGNVYAFGYHQGTTDFDPGLNNFNQTANAVDAFILKLDASGTFQWLRRFAGSGSAFAKDIEIDAQGNIVVTGLFSGTIDFDPTFGTSQLTASGSDLFLARYNSSGLYIWADRIDGAGQLFEPGLDLDGSNNIHLTAVFSSSVTIDGTTLTGSGAENVFLAKHNTSGDVLWTHVIHGAGGGIGLVSRPIVVDGSANTYLVGSFQGSISFGSQAVASAGQYDVYLAKFNVFGTPQWIRSMGGSQNDLGHAVDWDSTGVYVAGTYWGDGDWDPGPGVHLLGHVDDADIHFAKYSAAGHLIWAHGLGSAGAGPISGDDQLFNLTVDAGQVFINSLLGGAVDFDLGPGTTTSSGHGFFAKYSQGGCVTPPPNLRAWFPLDSASGSTVANLASNRTGVRVGPTAATGQVAGAFDFDGSSDYVYAWNHWSLNVGTDDFTFEAWIKTTDRDGTILSKRQQNGNQHVGYVFMVFDGRLLLQMADGANDWFNYHDPYSTRVDDGDWHLVAVSVDRSSASGGRFYVDGSLVHTFNPTNRSGSLSNSSRLEIGKTTNSIDYLDGVVDEVTIFDRALSASEIGSLWQAGSFGRCKPGPPPTPLGATLQCLGGGGGNVYACQVTVVGGSGGNSFSWSYFGDGLMAPSGSSANVYINTCTGGLNQITVTVTDSSGATATASQSLPCLAGPGFN